MHNTHFVRRRGKSKAAYQMSFLFLKDMQRMSTYTIAEVCTASYVICKWLSLCRPIVQRLPRASIDRRTRLYSVLCIMFDWLCRESPCSLGTRLLTSSAVPPCHCGSPYTSSTLQIRKNFRMDRCPLWK